MVGTQQKAVRAAGTFLHQGCEIARYTEVTQVAGRPFQMVVCAEKDTGLGEAGADGRRVQRGAFLEEGACSDRTASGPGAPSGRPVGEEGSAEAQPQERCIWPLVEFLLPKYWGYCLSPHGCPVLGTRPGQRQVLSKYL